jgi:hypothetical protein
VLGDAIAEAKTWPATDGFGPVASHLTLRSNCNGKMCSGGETPDDG